MASFEAYEILRQSRALSDQTGYFRNSCDSIVDSLTTLSNIFKGSTFEVLINKYIENYNNLSNTLSQSYYDLALTMDVWAKDTIANELNTVENITKYNEQISSMLSVLNRRSQ